MLKAGIATLTQLFSGSLGRVVANASSRIYVGIISFALLPVYLKFLGAEALGVVSAFASIQAIIALFDCSMAPSLTREISRARAGEQGWDYVNDLSKTMEFIYIGLAMLVGLGFYLAVPLVAHYWLNPDQLSSKEIGQALSIAALAIAFQWPATLYSGGLVGLQKQRALAVFSVVTTTLRSVVTVVALYFVPTLEIYFGLAAAFAIVQTVYLGWLFWSSVTERPKKIEFIPSLIKTIWKFSVGVSLITVSSVLLL